MEAVFLFFLFVFVLIIFIILLTFKGSVSFNQRLMIKMLNELKADMVNIKKTGIEQVTPEKEPEIHEQVKIAEEPQVIKKEEVLKEPVIKEEPELVEQTVEKKEEPELVQETMHEENLLAEKTTQTVYQQSKVKTTTEFIKQPKKKTDFEKFIGENLLNKIGIVILVLALIFFGKYAVDKGWLNDTAKVVSIVLIGGALIAIAHRLRNNYRAFSSVLAGGGIASLYISIAIGFQLYNLFSQTAAFLILIVITILAVLLSLAYDKKELAVIAIFGGFATPMLVSTGQGNYKVLFTYILILDIGMLVLAYFKKWNLVNFVANFATLILYAVWIVDAYFNKNNLPHMGALIFVTAFYLIFFLMNIINNIKENAKFTAFEFLMLVANTFLYFWAGMFIINTYRDDYMGLFTICLAVFNFLFAFPLYKNKQIDKNLIFLLIGLVLTFTSIAIPVQFKGEYITLFWAAESVLLLWLYQQSGIKLMKLASYIVSFFLLISISMDWFQIYFDRSSDQVPLPILLNAGFITGIVSALSFVINIWLLRKEILHSESNYEARVFSNLYKIILILLLYIIFQVELVYQVDTYYNDFYLTSVAVSFYNYLYISIILVWATLKRIKYILEGITVIGLISLLVYLTAVLPYYRDIIDEYLIGEISYNFSFLHFVTVALVLLICYFSWSNMGIIFKNQKVLSNIMLWFSIIVGIIVLSYELDYMVLLGNKPEFNKIYDLVRQSHLIGWPILWGSLAFVLMILGMKKNEKMLRIIGISLFFFALLKLFIVDVWTMPEGGRIAAFISLGVLLLVISFMYQKLKKIIFEDDDEKTVNDKIEE